MGRRSYRHGCGRIARLADCVSQLLGIGCGGLHLNKLVRQVDLHLGVLVRTPLSARVMVLTQWPQVMSLTLKAIMVLSNKRSC